MNKELSLWIFKENKKKYPPHICPRVPPRCQTVTFQTSHSQLAALFKKLFWLVFAHSVANYELLLGRC